MQFRFFKKRVKNHDFRHDPRPKKVAPVIRELRICRTQRKRKVKRDGRVITYEVFESTELGEWTIFGFTKPQKDRRFPERVSGFLMVVVIESRIVKTFYEFSNRHPRFLEGKINRFKSYRSLEPKDFPDLNADDIKLLKTRF